MFQESFEKILRKFKGSLECLNNISRIFQGTCKNTLGKGVSNVFAQKGKSITNFNDISGSKGVN